MAWIVFYRLPPTGMIVKSLISPQKAVWLGSEKPIAIKKAFIRSRQCLFPNEKRSEKHELPDCYITAVVANRCYQFRGPGCF